MAGGLPSRRPLLFRPPYFCLPLSPTHNARTIPPEMQGASLRNPTFRQVSAVRVGGEYEDEVGMNEHRMKNELIAILEVGATVLVVCVGILALG